MKRKIVNFLLFILLSMMALSEVPHTYVTDNPKSEVHKVETIKEREKADLNLSVTKVKSQTAEVSVDVINKKMYFCLDMAKFIISDTDKINIYENEYFSGKKLDYTLNEDLLTIIYSNQIPNLIYIEVLGSDQNVKKIIKGNMVIPQVERLNTQIEKLEIRLKEYTYILEKNYFYNYGHVEKGTYEPEKNIRAKTVKGTMQAQSQGLNSHHGHDRTGYGRIFLDIFNKDGSLKETKTFTFWTYIGGDNQVTVREHEFINETFDKPYKIRLRWSFDCGGYEAHGARAGSVSVIKYIKMTFTHDIIKALEGKSILTVKEYYPVNQFMEFNSTTVDDGEPLSLENKLRDVSLTTSGEGIVKMEQGDTLEIDGKKSTIGSGGNLAKQKAVIGNLEYTYKVENGKLRLALNKWGVLEPDRDISINLYRVEEGNENKIAEHTLTVKSPRRVEGSSDLAYDNDYQIRTFVRFGGISLTAPGISSLETPVPAGVSLSSQAGQGIPFMEEGDILEVNDGVTRAVHQFTIGAGGTLERKIIRTKDISVSLYVENGKLRAGLNNWSTNKSLKLNLRLIRGTNEIMNHAIGFKVPEAPFNIKENGLLDFGRVTAGSKRTAETNIVLEMLNDVDSVKFNLKDTQPVMENANGKQLKVNEIQTIVKQQGERTYLVKLHGKLIIPEDTQMGEYSGSTILELRIK